MAILGAGPIGYFTNTRRSGSPLYLAAWAIAYPIHTLAVHLTEGRLAPVSLAFNVPIVALGVALDRLGSSLGERRRDVPAMEPGMA